MSRERFAVDVGHSGSETTVHLRGELDDASALVARGALDEALARSPRRLVLELSELRFMDSAGIWLVVETHRRCLAAGCELLLAGERHPAVTNALELSGVEGVISQRDTGAVATATQRVKLRLYLSGGASAGAAVTQAFRALADRLHSASRRGALGSRS